MYKFCYIFIKTFIWLLLIGFCFNYHIVCKLKNVSINFRDKWMKSLRVSDQNVFSRFLIEFPWKTKVVEPHEHSLIPRGILCRTRKLMRTKRLNNLFSFSFSLFFNFSSFSWEDNF